VALVAGTAAAHLAKGLDAEEAAASLVVLAMLFRYRSSFDVSGDPAALRPLVATSLALATLGALLRLDHVFQLDRLLSFSGKFRPDWEPRYVLLERLSDLPLVGLSYLRVESLLTPPLPWAKPKDVVPNG
jgi:lysylphosphatidylglycerol synthetase-like protein (DUF2156 family)